MLKWFKENIIKKYVASLYQRKSSLSAPAPASTSASASTPAPAPGLEGEQESTNLFSSNGKRPLRESIASSSSSRLPNKDYHQIDLSIFDADGDGGYTNSDYNQLIIYQSWREYIEQFKKSKVENKLMGVMSKTTLTIGGQLIAAVIANAVIRNSPPSWAVYTVEFAVFVGLCFTLAGLTLRGRRQALSTVMIKIGVMATASSVIISLASTLQPAVAWTVAPLAFLLAAAAVALAC